MFKRKPLILITLFSLIFLLDCEQSSEPKETTGHISGVVQSAGENNAPIHPSFIFSNDSLVCTTDSNGEFTISPLNEGRYSFTCSALGYRDTTLQINVVGGQTAKPVLLMTPDVSTGRVYAEFQDNFLFRQELQTDSSMAAWNAQELFDGVTGATLQSKTLRMELPSRQIFIGDSLISITDDFAQAWFDVQAGTYPLRGACEGYVDSTQVVRIVQDERVYVTFFLDRAE
jgi:hypothetical protein